MTTTQEYNSNSSGKRKKDVLRTTRISKDLDRILEDEAKEKNVTVNTLINLILTRYVEWDRMTEKFGAVTLSSAAQFKAILDAVDDDNKIAELGRNAGRFHKGLVNFWLGKADLQTYLQFYSILSKYSGIFTFRYESDAEGLTLLHEHKLGMKWSIYGRNFSEVGFKDIGIYPESEITERTVTTRLHPSNKHQ